MDGLKWYKAFIDGLVNRRDDVVARRVRQKNPWLPTASETLTRQNPIIESLNDEDRDVIADMLQHAREGGIHDTLVHFSEAIHFDGLRLVVDGTPLPVESFGTELFWDWTARCAGDVWPDER